MSLQSEYLGPDEELQNTASDDFTRSDALATIPENPEASVSYLVPGMTEDKLGKLGQDLGLEITNYWAADQLRRTNLEEWRRDWELTQSAQTGPWDNSSVVRAPYVRMACQQHTMRLGEIINADPPFSAVPRVRDAVQACKQIEEAVSSKLEQDRWRSAMTDMFKLLPVDGNALMLVEWATETVRAPMLQVEVDLPGAAASMLGGALPGIAWAQSVQQDENGKAKLFLTHQYRTVFEGIRLTPVKWQDAIYLPLSARDPADCWGLGERKMVRGLELKRGAESGKYLKDAVNRLLSMPEDIESIDRGQTLVDEGIDPTPSAYNNSEQDPMYRVYYVDELYYYADLDEDGKMEWYIVTIHRDSRLVIRCQYSPYWHGKAAYVPFRYMRRPRELFGCGIPELLALLQDAATAATNDFFDLISIMVGSQGNWIYDDRAGIRPGEWIVEPGRPIKVDDLNAMKPNPAAEGIPEALKTLIVVLDKIKDWVDLLTATSNPTLGNETDTHKTLGEVQLVFGAAMAIFQSYAQEVALDVAVMLDMIRWNIAQFGSQGGEVQYRKRTAGGVDFSSIDTQTLLEDVDIEPAGFHQFADQQTKLTIASMVQQVFLTHPLTKQNPQVLMDGLDEYLAATRYQDREEIMGYVRDGVMKMMQQQQIAQALQMQQLQQGMSQPPNPNGVPTQANGNGALPPGGGPPAPPAAPGMPPGPGPEAQPPLGGVPANPLGGM